MDEAALREAINQELLHLANLADERRRVHQRLEALQAQLRAQGTQPPQTEGSSLTNNAKIALFRRLFRGREDVYPKLWVSGKTGKKGYSPVCSNEWLPGTCGKPKVKCGECPNQEFAALGDREVAAHLKGDHVIGVYALLPDETCWFLAVDFDKHAWTDDVAAFREACKAHDVPVAVERSRSGNGAHAWFFFAAPINASTARKLGCFLLTDAMARRHQVKLDSYDRLFPNQDTMPRGGFGNLIALPLQGQARRQGNSVFVDEAMEPYRDQWGYLASIELMAPAKIEALVQHAERRDQVLGVRIAVTEEDPTPWVRRPTPTRVRISGPLPEAIDVVLANCVFVPKEGLPTALMNQVVRLAAFQNPEFYKKQAMRMSTVGTPRILTCAEEHSHHLALPRGCLPELAELCRDHRITCRVDDRREPGVPVDFTFQGELSPLQRLASESLIADDFGVFVAPPGIGKTVVAIHTIAARGRSTLVLVDRKPLLEQWRAQLAQFLAIPLKEVGQIGGGKDRLTGRIDVAMLQSLSRRKEDAPALDGYGHVVVDECHHVAAQSFERVLNRLKPRFVTGLTATPYRRDGQQPIIHMQCGPTRFEIDTRQQQALRPLERRLIVRETGFQAPALASESTIQPYYAALVADEARNALILQDVADALAEGRSPILLTERKDHLEALAANLRPHVRHLVVLAGGMTPKQQRETTARIAAIPPDEERLLLATGRYIGEGFDDARLDTLFLALPVSWKGTIVQYAGRLHRPYVGKSEVRIYDYVDGGVPMLAGMFGKRLRGYRKIGYEEPKDGPSCPKSAK